MIRFFAKNRCAFCVTDDKLTKGSVGMEVRFELEGWEAAPNRVAVFRAGSVKVDVALLGELSCTVPPEVLANPGDMLTIGVYGTDGDGAIVIPTVYAEAGRVRLGTAPSGITPTPTTQPLIDQLLAAAENAEDLAQSVRNDADSGVFDGAPGVGVPTGGTVGQVLKKVSGTDYDTEWANESGGGGGGAVDSVNGQTGDVVLTASDVRALADSTTYVSSVNGSSGSVTVTVPTKSSDLQNDSGFITSAPVTSVNNKTGAVSLTASDVGAGTYSKPSGGIPKTDLASAVQTSLGKADTALQSAPVTSVNGQTGAVTVSVPSAATSAPANIGTAAIGTSDKFAKADHVHDYGSDFVTALLQLASKVAYIDGNGQTYYDALEAALTHRVLSSISAVYTQSGTVYTHDSLDSLKSDLVVTATYSDSSSETVAAADYALSGTLTAGTSTITVSYGGKTTTFNVTVTAGVPSTYQIYDYIQGTVAVSIPQAALIKLKSYTSLSSLSTEFFYKKLASGNSGVCIFGRRDGTGNTKSYAFYVGANELGYHLHGNDSNPTPAAADNVVHKVVYTNTAASPSSLSVDGETPVSVVWVNSNVLNLAPTILTNAFDDSSKSGINDGTQVGNIKFSDLSENLVGNYFPVVRTADNVIGMFDAVEQTFYTSATSTYCTIGNSNCKYTVGNWS